MKKFSNLEVWFATGSQDLYGEKTLQQVDKDSMEIAQGLNNCEKIPVKVVFKPVLTSSDSILKLCVEANSAPNCVGVITWMHTFSPAKMWIAGLKILNKPLLHLHTQFNRDIPYADIDMDFMNLNQSAHGGREYGFIVSRLRKNRKVLVGHWKDEAIRDRVGIWARVAVAWHDWQNGKVARFGDNMREVAVTEGDKVEAQIRFGFSVSGFGIGDLVRAIKEVDEAEVAHLVEEYMTLYDVDKAGQPGGEYHTNVRVQARYELGMKMFLEAGWFHGFHHDFRRLAWSGAVARTGRSAADGPGLWLWCRRGLETFRPGACRKGHGCRITGRYFLHGRLYLPSRSCRHEGAGCPHAGNLSVNRLMPKPKLEVHPLGIGGKADPARLVFNVPDGPAVNASIIDMGNRFRMIVNAVDVVTPDADFPKLPVARAMWKPQPDLQTGAAAWILAGGAHHTAFSQQINKEFLEDFAEIADIEFLLIDEKTNISDFKKELRWNEVYYMLNKGLK